MIRFSNLNVFQEVMALWEEIHPYNAGQVVRLRGLADPGSLQKAIQVACHHSDSGGYGLIGGKDATGMTHLTILNSVRSRQGILRFRLCGKQSLYR